MILHDSMQSIRAVAWGHFNLAELFGDWMTLDAGAMPTCSKMCQQFSTICNLSWSLGYLWILQRGSFGLATQCQGSTLCSKSRWTHRNGNRSTNGHSLRARCQRWEWPGSGSTSRSFMILFCIISKDSTISIDLQGNSSDINVQPRRELLLRRQYDLWKWNVRCRKRHTHTHVFFPPRRAIFEHKGPRLSNLHVGVYLHSFKPDLHQHLLLIRFLGFIDLKAVKAVQPALLQWFDPLRCAIGLAIGIVLLLCAAIAMREPWYQPSGKPGKYDNPIIPNLIHTNSTDSAAIRRPGDWCPIL